MRINIELHLQSPKDLDRAATKLRAAADQLELAAGDLRRMLARKLEGQTPHA